MFDAGYIKDEFKTAKFYRNNINKACSINHRLSDREYWNGLKGQFYDDLKKLAPQHKGELPILKLSDFMRFKTEGSRIAYETPFVVRRRTFLWYAYMEAIENEGRYFDDMLDTLWALLEETHWCVPAHLTIGRIQDIVPHEGDSVLDLFTGMTAGYVSQVYYIFKEQFDGISTEIGDRIRRKIRREVFDHLLEDNYWWMGFGDRVPNNWNPWIISNVIKSIINLEEYGEYECRILGRAIEILDRYFSQCPDDGGCDEGAGYWSHAGGNVIECLSFMHMLTNGKIDVLFSEKVSRICEFPYHAYVTGRHLLGFSDLKIIGSMEYGFLHHVAKCTENRNVKALAAKLYVAQKEQIGRLESTNFDWILYKAEAMGELDDEAEQLEFPLEHYYESVRLFIAREKSTAPFGLFLAVKANHNKESHNHLDTGNIIVYQNEVPFIVDVGCKVYNASTFSKDRYTMWHTRSAYHNLPIIGGCEQVPGARFRAEKVQCKDGSFRCNLETAYDADFIHQYVREVKLEREDARIILRDRLELQEVKEVSFVFMTPAEVTVSEQIDLSYQGESMVILPSHQFDVKVENIVDNDTYIAATWGNELKRIIFTTKTRSDTFEFIIKGANVKC